MRSVRSPCTTKAVKLIDQPDQRVSDQLARLAAPAEKEHRRSSPIHIQKESPAKEGSQLAASPQWPDLFGHAASTAKKNRP